MSDTSTALINEHKEVSEEEIHNKLGNLALLLSQLDDRLDQIAREEKEVSAERHRVSDELMKHMQALGIDKFKNNLGSFSVLTSYRAQIEDQLRAMQWFKDHGLAGIVKESIHWKTLSSELKRIVENDNEQALSLREAGVSYYIDEKISIRSK